MRVLVDTNVLFSALVYPKSVPAKALVKIAEEDEVVLCSQSIDELRDVIGRKAPQFLSDLEVFLTELPYELIPAVENAAKLIRDPKDQPILNAAIIYDVDLIVTGDKDFLSMELDHPVCMKAADYLQIKE